MRLLTALVLLFLAAAAPSTCALASHSKPKIALVAAVKPSTAPLISTITCDRRTKTWYSSPTFTFTAVAGFGGGKVQSYRYAWDQSPTHTWTGSEPSWSSGTLPCTAGCQNSWYLHLKSYNSAGAAKGKQDLGPYNYRPNGITLWSRIYEGVEAATGYKKSPRLMRAFAIKVDLRNKHVSLVASRGKGSALGVGDPKPGTAFLSEYGCKVAVNASFAWPANKRGKPLPDPTNIWGVVISNGTVVSGPYPPPCDSVLMFTRDKVPSLIQTSTVPTGQWTAVAGGHIFLINGICQFPGTSPPLGDPTTGMGLSQDNRYLILLVVDGRQPGWSDGDDWVTESQWMLDFGAWNAVQMDGGGSSSITRKDVGVWNHSCWNTSDPQDIRPVTVHLGIITTN